MTSEQMECGCGCDCDNGDYCESPEFFNCRNVKARKPHKCCECGGQIKKGDMYEYTVMKFDGELQVFHTCITCSQIRVDYGGCCAYGELRESVWRCLGVDYVTGETNR